MRVKNNLETLTQPFILQKKLRPQGRVGGAEPSKANSFNGWAQPTFPL